MIHIHVENREGTESWDLQAQEGEVLMQVLRNADIPIEGTCEGCMACSTCHVIVARDWFPKLAEIREEEEDMLDLAADLSLTSRLSCQIILSPKLDGLRIQLPKSVNNALF